MSFMPKLGWGSPLPGRRILHFFDSGFFGTVDFVGQYGSAYEPGDDGDGSKDYDLPLVGGRVCVSLFPGRIVCH